MAEKLSADVALRYVRRKYRTTERNGTDSEFMFLPCSDAELMRAARRLGTSFPYDLKVTVEDTSFSNAELDKLLDNTDIYTMNEFARLMDSFDETETDKYLTVIGYMESQFGVSGDLKKIVRFGKNLDAFTHYANAMCNEDLGNTLLEEHDVPEDMWDYFDAERYGEDVCKTEHGHFTGNGYVGINNFAEIKPCLEQNDGMGGMT